MADPFEVSARALVAAYTVATLVSGRGFWGIGDHQALPISLEGM